MSPAGFPANKAFAQARRAGDARSAAFAALLCGEGLMEKLGLEENLPQEV